MYSVLYSLYYILIYYLKYLNESNIFYIYFKPYFYIINAKVTCLSVLLLRPNRWTDFNEIWHRDILILEVFLNMSFHRLIFAAITDYKAGGAARKSLK